MANQSHCLVKRPISLFVLMSQRGQLREARERVSSRSRWSPSATFFHAENTSRLRMCGSSKNIKAGTDIVKNIRHLDSGCSTVVENLPHDNRVVVGSNPARC